MSGQTLRTMLTRVKGRLPEENVQMLSTESIVIVGGSTLERPFEGLRPGKTSRGERSNVVYRIHCDCGRVYIGETIRRLETRLKEHKEVHRKADTETSAVAEHSWNTQHAIQWGETTILDQTRRTKELKIKEAMHILMTPLHQCLNRDE